MEYMLPAGVRLLLTAIREPPQTLTMGDDFTWSPAASQRTHLCHTLLMFSYFHLLRILPLVFHAHVPLPLPSRGIGEIQQRGDGLHIKILWKSSQSFPSRLPPSSSAQTPLTSSSKLPIVSFSQPIPLASAPKPFLRSQRPLEKLVIPPGLSRV